MPFLSLAPNEDVAARSGVCFFFLEISSGEGEAPGGVSSRERRRAADAAPGGGGQAAEDSRYEGRFT
jgi:hypothetical protein